MDSVQDKSPALMAILGKINKEEDNKYKCPLQDLCISLSKKEEDFIQTNKLNELAHDLNLEGNRYYGLMLEQQLIVGMYRPYRSHRLVSNYAQMLVTLVNLQNSLGDKEYQAANFRIVELVQVGIVSI